MVVSTSIIDCVQDDLICFKLVVKCHVLNLADSCLPCHLELLTCFQYLYGASACVLYTLLHTPLPTSYHTVQHSTVIQLVIWSDFRTPAC